MLATPLARTPMNGAYLDGPDGPPPWMDDGAPAPAPQRKRRPYIPYLRRDGDVALALDAHERNERAQVRRLVFGVEQTHSLMMVPGAMTVVVARSSGGKTSAIYDLAHHACRGIAARGKLDSEVVVVLSGEDQFYDIARFVSGKPDHPSAPLIALDKYRRGPDGQIMVGAPPLTLEEMLAEVSLVCDEAHLEVSAICLDYAGAIPVEGLAAAEGNRIALFDRTSELLIGAARAYDCPAVLGAQANRSAHGGIPRADSVFGGDVLFHHAHCMFSLFACGDDPDAKGDDYHVNLAPGRKIARIEGSVWLQVLKNRGGPRKGMLLHRDPGSRRFTHCYKPDDYRP